MKKAVFFVAVSCALFACHQPTALTDKIETSDSVVINFTTASSDSVIKTFVTTQKAAIKKLAELIDTKAVDSSKCSTDGNIAFYSKGQLILPVVFNYTDKSCRHFLFDNEGKTNSTKITNEGADFLKAMFEGKSEF